MSKQHKKTYSYWMRKDGTRWRSVKVFEKVEGFKRLVATKKIRYRRVSPKKDRSYWRKVKEKELEHWMGRLQALVDIVYVYSVTTNYDTEKMRGKYKVNSKKELYDKLEEDAQTQFMDKFSTSQIEYISIISVKVRKIYGDSPPLPKEWGF